MNIDKTLSDKNVQDPDLSHPEEDPQEDETHMYSEEPNDQEEESLPIEENDDNNKAKHSEGPNVIESEVKDPHFNTHTASERKPKPASTIQDDKERHEANMDHSKVHKPEDEQKQSNIKEAKEIVKSTGDESKKSKAQEMKTAVLKNTTAPNQQKPKILNNTDYLKKLEADQSEVDESIKKGLSLINIVTCFNCQNHQYCTHHKEEKYDQQYRELKKFIEDSTPSVVVARNHGSKNLIMGAFEIYYKGELVFSKLNAKRWPNHNWVASKIKSLKRGSKD